MLDPIKRQYIVKNVRNQNTMPQLTCLFSWKRRFLALLLNNNTQIPSVGPKRFRSNTFPVDWQIHSALLLLTTGCWRWLRVLCQAAAGDSVLRPQLLRGVWQRGRHDERGRVPDVLLPGTELSFMLSWNVNPDLDPTVFAVDVLITTISPSFRFWSRQKKRPSTSTEGWTRHAPSPPLAPLRHLRRGERLAPPFPPDSPAPPLAGLWPRVPPQAASNTAASSQ